MSPDLEALRDKLVTAQEFAFVTRSDYATVLRRCRAGKQAGAVKVGREWRINLDLALRDTEPTKAPDGIVLNRPL